MTVTPSILYLANTSALVSASRSGNEALLSQSVPSAQIGNAGLSIGEATFFGRLAGRRAAGAG